MVQSTDGILAFGWDIGESAWGDKEWAKPIWDAITPEYDDDTGADIGPSESDRIEALYFVHSGIEVPPDPREAMYDAHPSDWFYEFHGVRTPQWQAWLDEHQEEIDAHEEAKKAALEACPFEFRTHCSDEAPMHLLIVRGSLKRNIRGYPEEISSAWVNEGFDSWPETADRIKEMLGVPDAPDPALLLASYWG